MKENFYFPQQKIFLSQIFRSFSVQPALTLNDWEFPFEIPSIITTWVKEKSLVIVVVAGAFFYVCSRHSLFLSRVERKKFFSLTLAVCIFLNNTAITWSNYGFVAI